MIEEEILKCQTSLISCCVDVFLFFECVSFLKMFLVIGF